MWLGTSSSSSSLSPLPSSHLHRIRKLYEYPEYDLPIASTSSKIASSASGSSSSSSGNLVTEEASSVEEGLQSLSVRHGREESSKSAPPALMQRKVTPEQAKAFYPVSYSKLCHYTSSPSKQLKKLSYCLSLSVQSAANGCKSY